MNRIYSIVFLLITLLMSCKDEEPHIDTTVVSSPSHNIQVVEDDDNLQIRIEVLMDETDNRMDDFPNSDLVTIYIDQNSNGIIDKDLDWGLGVLEFNTICAFFVRDSMTISGCGILNSGAKLSSDFAATSLSSTEHIIWDISIPKDELDDSKTLSMVVKIFAGGEGYTTFPRDNIYSESAVLSFDKVLTVEW